MTQNVTLIIGGATDLKWIEYLSVVPKMNGIS